MTLTKPIRQAYKGYLITEGMSGGFFFITKDGTNIGTAKSYVEAMAIVDSLAA